MGIAGSQRIVFLSNIIYIVVQDVAASLSCHYLLTGRSLSLTQSPSLLTKRSTAIMPLCSVTLPSNWKASTESMSRFLIQSPTLHVCLSSLQEGRDEVESLGQGVVLRSILIKVSSEYYRWKLGATSQRLNYANGLIKYFICLGSAPRLQIYAQCVNWDSLMLHHQPCSGLQQCFNWPNACNQGDADAAPIAFQLSL